MGASDAEKWIDTDPVSIDARREAATASLQGAVVGRYASYARAAMVTIFSLAACTGSFFMAKGEPDREISAAWELVAHAVIFLPILYYALFELGREKNRAKFLKYAESNRDGAITLIRNLSGTMTGDPLVQLQELEQEVRGLPR